MVTLDDILAAAERIRDMVRVTPVKAAPAPAESSDSSSSDDDEPVRRRRTPKCD